MAPELESDPTVAALMLGGSAIRHLAHHLAGTPNVVVSLDVLACAGLGVRIALHGQPDDTTINRIADSLGLPSPTVARTVGGDAHHHSSGRWRGYDVTVSALVYAFEGAGL